MDATRPRYKRRGPFLSLRAFFERTGRHQRDIAADVGISESHLSNIVSGKRTPSLAIAKALSQLTNVPIESIGDEKSSQ
jgi:transcriptional regulator with XRE-family HTH domain